MIFTLFLILIGFILLKVIIIPYYKIQQYSKYKGVRPQYFPLFGYIWDQIKDIQNHNDQFYFMRRIVIGQDRPRALATNFKTDFLLYLFDSELSKEFLSKSHLYEKDKELFGFFEELTGNSILKQYGKAHKRKRQVLSKIFNFNFISSLIPEIVKITHESFDQMENQYPSLERVPILDTIAAITSEIIVRMFIKQQSKLSSAIEDNVASRLRKITVKMGTAIQKPISFLLNRKYRKMLGIFKDLDKEIQDFRDEIMKMIKEKEKAYYERGRKNENDLIEYFFQFRDQNPDAYLTDTDILDDYMTFFFAGTDTTSRLVQIALYLLTQHKNVKNRLKSEINEKYGGDSPNYEKISSLEYMQAFMKETLRYHTPVTGIFTRRALETHTIGDITIQRGDMVAIDIICKGFDGRYFKDPLQFNPDRWLDGKSPSDPFAYLPFSAGPHNCIGQHLAQIEFKIILSEFMRRYDLDCHDDFELKMALILTYEPVNPIILNLNKKY